MTKAQKRKKYINRNIPVFVFLLVLGVIVTLLHLRQNLSIGKITSFVPQEVSFIPQATSTAYKLLVVGDIFLDRHIDELTQKDNSKIQKEKLNKSLYSYPFQGLNTLEREKYDAWVGNLECPVTEEQSTKFEKSEWLKFSCKKEYLPELAKYFDIVSLANNHTDNMNKEAGLIETRRHLDNAGIKHFGHYDNSRLDELCKVIKIEQSPHPNPPPIGEGSATSLPSARPNLEIAFCGFHGVYKLPTEKELEIIKKYSDKYITIVMPHQGVEYEFTSGTYQKKLYRKMIDNGADVVIGSHPHVIQNVETYRNRKIFYSLGNFIFDQSWAKTREHLVVDMEIIVDNTATKNENGKPTFYINYTPIFTSAGADFITRKKNLTQEEYENKLRVINYISN
jgi:poly-gamma-glutamate synthesis protein (capsule biosynthesis protein)